MDPHMACRITLIPSTTVEKNTVLQAQWKLFYRTLIHS